jgi:predicted transcriptional regulator
MSARKAVLKTRDPEQTALSAAVREGLADSKSGRVIPYEEIRRWLLSWGSEKELLLPKCP